MCVPARVCVLLNSLITEKIQVTTKEQTWTQCQKEKYGPFPPYGDVRPSISESVMRLCNKEPIKEKNVPRSAQWLSTPEPPDKRKENEIRDHVHQKNTKQRARNHGGQENSPQKPTKVQKKLPNRKRQSQGKVQSTIKGKRREKGCVKNRKGKDQVA